MRIALLGAGRIGRLHGRLVAAEPDVTEMVVYDVVTDNAMAAAEAVGGRTVASPEEALAGADGAIVAASTDAHAGLARMAIDAGVPLFCEKPLAFSLAETAELVARAEASHAIVQVGFQRRFDPACLEARRLVETGELGTVYLVRLISHDHEPPPDAYIPGSGGLWRDSSIHDFDILRWVTGQEVDEVYAAGSVRNFPVFATYDDIDTGAAILTMADGTLGVLGQTRHDPHGYDVRMEVMGSKDAVAVGLDARTPIRSLEVGAPPMSEPWPDFLTRFEAAYRAELLAFVRVVRGEIPSPCTARDALQAMRISVAAATSRAEHRPVSLSEIP